MIETSIRICEWLKWMMLKFAELFLCHWKLGKLKKSANSIDLYDYFFGMLTRCELGQPERWLQGAALWMAGLQSHEERQLIQTPPENVNDQWRFHLIRALGKNLFFLFWGHPVLYYTAAQRLHAVLVTRLIIMTREWWRVSAAVTECLSSDTASRALVKWAYAS